MRNNIFCKIEIASAIYVITSLGSNENEFSFIPR